LGLQQKVVNTQCGYDVRKKVKCWDIVMFCASLGKTVKWGSCW